MSDSIEPFWKRLRAISLYPMHSAALITIGVLALCRLVQFLPFGWFFNLFVWVALFKYAFECLRETANGRMEPPEIATTADDSLGWAQIRLQIVFVVLNVLGFVLLGPIGGTIVAIVLALALPGAIMSLAMDENLLHAINPSTWIAIIGRIGWAYVAVAALYFIFNISQANAQALVVPHLPKWIGVIVFYLIAHYVVVATFHLMGYLIYQYHDELGHEPVERAPLGRPLALDPDQNVLDEAQALVREGNPEAAADRLGEALRGRGGSEAAHLQYRKLLALTGRRDESLRHGREWIAILIGQDKDRRALDVARECVALDPEFRPSDGDQTSRLAHKAADANLAQLALTLTNGFNKRYPKHAHIPKCYLLAAKLLAERFGKEAEARALLDQLARAYPDHPLAPDVAAYRAFLDKLAPATPRAVSAAPPTAS